VAFPLISAGAYGYPKDQALAVAVREIKAFLADHELEITLVVFNRSDFRPPASTLAAVRRWLDRRLPEPLWGAAYAAAPVNAPPAPTAQAAMAAPPEPRKQQKKIGFFTWPEKKKEKEAAGSAASPDDAAPLAAAFEDAQSLEQRLRCLDESFSEMLLRKIDEKGLTDAACYKRANVDRKLFSKIRSDPHYRPSKPTAIAFAVALELPLPEARELLMKAGFALSPSSKFDVIIEYFITKGIYDIFEINEALFAFDQTLLGA
jgi:hypothetical protein